MMSDTAPGASGAQLSGRSFSALPSTRATPGSAVQAAGSICAAQPVTTMRASGRSRCARADRLASLPLRLRCHGAGIDDHGIGERGRVPANHLALIGVQPAAEGEDLDASWRERREVDRAGKGGRDRAGHQHVAILAPLDRRARRHPGSPSRSDRRGPAGARSPPPRRRPNRRRSVSPAPRSQTRSRMRCGPRTCAKPILARSGNSGSCSSTGPSVSTGRVVEVVDEERRMRVAHARGRRIGDAGRPRDRDAACPSARASGMSRQSSRAGPMSTATRPSADTSAAEVAGHGADRHACGGRFRAPASRRRSAWRCRRPRPPPVRVANAHEGGRIRARAAGSMMMSWSQPMPVRRSARAAARDGVRPSGAARSSNTTKSLPQPCILTKGASMAADIGPPCVRK